MSCSTPPTSADAAAGLLRFRKGHGPQDVTPTSDAASDGIRSGSSAFRSSKHTPVDPAYVGPSVAHEDGSPEASSFERRRVDAEPALSATFNPENLTWHDVNPTATEGPVQTGDTRGLPSADDAADAAYLQSVRGAEWTAEYLSDVSDGSSSSAHPLTFEAPVASTWDFERLFRRRMPAEQRDGSTLHANAKRRANMILSHVGQHAV